MQYKQVTKKVMSKKNFLTGALAVRYKITKDDSTETIGAKINGSWRDPNRPIPEGLEQDENGFVEF